MVTRIRKKKQNSQEYYQILRITIGQYAAHAEGIVLVTNMVLSFSSLPCYLQLQTIIKIFFFFRQSTGRF